MLRVWKYFLFFFVCLVVALLFNLPIQTVLPYVKLPNTVRLSGVDGSVLSGNAREITIDNFQLRNVRYRYLPSCIPLLKLCYRIQYDQGESRVAYDLLNGDTEVSRTLINYQAAELAANLPNKLVNPTGRLELEIEDMSLVQGKPQTLNGRLVWRDLGLDDQGIKIDLGDYQIEFVGNPQGYDFKVNDLDGSLEIDGDGEIKPSGQFAMDIKITSKSGIDPQVKSVLNLVGKNTGHNKYRVERTGRLPPNITRQLF